MEDVFLAEELLGNCVLLMAAGHGTTMHLIGNGTPALLLNPRQSFSADVGMLMW